MNYTLKQLVSPERTFVAYDTESVKAAALVEIALSLRLMTKDLDQVWAERNAFCGWYNNELAKTVRLEKKVAALEKTIAKLKKAGPR